MPEIRLAFALAAGFLVFLATTSRLRFLSDELPGRLRQVAGLLLLLFVLLACVFYPAAGLGRGADIEPEAVWFPGLFAGHVLLAGSVLGWWFLAQRPAATVFLSLPRGRVLRGMAVGAAAGVAGWVVTVCVAAAAFGAMELVTGRPQMPEVPGAMIWLAALPVPKKLAVIAVAMTVEEAFFRAFLQRRIGLWLSSLLFALAHLSYGLPHMVVAVLAISLVIGALFERWQNLAACIAAHGIFDGIQLFVVLPLVLRYWSP